MRAQAKEECIKHVKELAESLEEESNHSIAAIKVESARKLSSVLTAVKATHEQELEELREQNFALEAEMERRVYDRSQ